MLAARWGVGHAFTAVARPAVARAVEPWGGAVRLPRDRPVVAVAGIARPDAFFADLEQAGWQLADRLAFRDHHAFTAGDVATMRQARARDRRRRRPDDRKGRGAAAAAAPARPRRGLRAADPVDRAGRRLHALAPGAARGGTRDPLTWRLPGATSSSTAPSPPSPRLVRALPQWASVGIGAAIGWLFYLVDAPHRRLAVANLIGRLPTQGAARGAGHRPRRLRALRLAPDRAAPLRRPLARADAGLDRVRGRRARGARSSRPARASLFITGHFGYWELHALAHAAALPADGVVVRALDNPRLNAWIEALRTSTGNKVIHRRGALRQILRVARRQQGRRDPRSISTSRPATRWSSTSSTGRRRRRRPWRRWRSAPARRSCRSSPCACRAAATG